MSVNEAAEAGNILLGCAPLRSFIVELTGDATITEGQIYRWVDQQYIPAGKLGGKIIASKKKIIAKISEAASGASDPAVEPLAPPRGRPPKAASNRRRRA